MIRIPENDEHHEPLYDMPADMRNSRCPTPIFAPIPDSRNMKNVIKIKPITPRPKYSCLKCPGYCCSYAEIEITERDIARLARHFDIDFDSAVERFTKYDRKKGIFMLRHRKDHIFASTCAL